MIDAGRFFLFNIEVSTEISLEVHSKVMSCYHD